MAKPTVDIVIIGGGIIGLATAMQIKLAYPEKSIQVLEKEAVIASHQTGHNSGVIHAGVYYAPGSLKAEFCKRGVEATISFCKEHKILYEQCGKLLVATTKSELQRLQALYDRCQENGLEPEYLDQNRLQEVEPNIVGLGAVLVKATGIVNYADVCKSMHRVVLQLGGEVHNNAEVTDIIESTNSVTVKTSDKTLTAKYVIACGGLQADRLACLVGLEIDFQIIPFRGEYYRLHERHNNIVRHLVYPIPDPALPFLGVHLTRMIDGSVIVGPNAVLSLARESYQKGQINVRDSLEFLRFSGFWAIMRKNWRSGLAEIHNSMSKKRYLKLCQKYCPSLVADDLEPYPAGIRAQAVRRDGTMVQDFLIKESPRTLHVCSAPSPAATCALPIAQHIVHKMKPRLKELV